MSTTPSSRADTSRPNQPKSRTNLLLSILFIVIGITLGFLFVTIAPLVIFTTIFVVADYSGPQPMPLSFILAALLLGAIPFCLLPASVFCFKKANKFYTKQKILSKPPQSSELQPQTPPSIQTQPTKTSPRLTNRTKILLGILLILLILFYFIGKYLLFHH